MRYSLDHNIFENIDTEEKAYWLGFIIADGSIQIRKSGQAILKISLAEIDYKHLEKWKQFLKTTMPIKYYLVGNSKTEVKSKSCELTITSKKIIQDLEKLGIGPKKSHIVEIPNIRSDLMKHLIKGIWDGDGSILYRYSNPNSSQMRPEVQLCGNYKITEYIRNFLIKQLDISKVKLHPVSSIFLFRYVGQSAKQICEFLYKDASIFLDRKYNKFNEFKEWTTLNNYPKNKKVQ